MPALERQASHLPTVLISALRPMPETKLITCSVSTQAVDVAEGLFNRIGIMEWIDSRLTGYLDGLSEFLESGVGCRGDVNVPGTDS